MHSLKSFSFFLFIILGVFALFFAVYSAHANSDDSASGWLWSGSNNSGGDVAGFGWVSANSINCDADENGESDGAAGCPSIGTSISDYGVHVPESDDADLTVSGYAWSENVGWISFQSSDVSGCPSGTCSAYRDDNSIRGWARILSIRDAGTNAGSFDGWIKLHSESGDPVNYGVTLDETVLPSEVSGYAWSDEFGWIDFSGAVFGPLSPDLVVCPTTATIGIGGQLQLSLYYSEAGEASCADTLSLTNVTTDGLSSWSSGDPLIATVGNASSKGLLVGVAQGDIVVTATYKGLSTTMFTHVTNATTPLCGNGTVDVGEACDDGASGNGTCDTSAACSPLCNVNVCQCIIN